MWTLPTTHRRVYPRNPLAVVVAQLRFQPILKVFDPEKIADFQDAVRVGTSFRGYELVDVQHVDIPVGAVRPEGGGATVRRERQHQFRAEDGATMSLSPNAATLEYRHHLSSERLIAEAKVVREAMDAAYAPVIPTRLGLRYVNHIDKALIEADLGRTVGWTDLIGEEFFSPPAQLVDMNDTLFHTQVTSETARGIMILKYGIVPSAKTGEPVFLLDLDRSVENPALDEVEDLLDRLAGEIFSVFDAACSRALVEWMEG